MMTNENPMQSSTCLNFYDKGGTVIAEPMEQHWLSSIIDCSLYLILDLIPDESAAAIILASFAESPRTRDMTNTEFISRSFEGVKILVLNLSHSSKNLEPILIQVEKMISRDNVWIDLGFWSCMEKL